MPDRLLVRVAVREAESWLLADHEAMRSLLDIHSGFPDAPDTLPDPKQTLLTLARQAPREVRLGLVRQEGTRLRQALRYNSLLSEWVFTEWEPERAAKRSESFCLALVVLSSITLRTCILSRLCRKVNAISFFISTVTVFIITCVG